MSEQYTEHIGQVRAGLAESMGKLHIRADVRTADTELGGIPALEVTIDGIASEGTAFWIHGGGYVAGSPRLMLSPAASIARAGRVRVVSVDYRLAPEHPFPAATDDLMAAYRALLATTPAEQVILGGESAGGGLAVWLAAAIRDAGLPLPRAVAVFSPAMDLSVSGPSIETKAAVDPILQPTGLAIDFGLYGGERQAEADPLSVTFREFPPLFIEVGTCEILLDDALRLAARAAHADVDVSLEVAAGKTHGFPIGDPTAEGAESALERVGAYLRARLDARA
jgi:acetyl esterase/lipase